MEIRIGVTYTAKEIAVETADDVKADAMMQSVEAAVSGEGSVLWLNDKKGRSVGIPADKIAYVEIGSEESTRPIGFG